MGKPIKTRSDFKGNFITKLVPGQWGRHGDLSRYYFGQDTKDDALEFSRYKPSRSYDTNARYIAIRKPEFKDHIIDAYFHHPEFFIDDTHYNGYNYTHYSGAKPVGSGGKYEYNLSGLGKFILTRGMDSNGDYISYYDIWDTEHNPGEKDQNKFENNKTEHFGAAKPFEVYDRIYLDDYYGVPEGKGGNVYLPEVIITPHKQGGVINYLNIFN